MNQPKPKKRTPRYQMSADKHLTDSELLSLKALLTADTTEVGLIIRLLLETGARVSELLLLEASDVLHDQQAIALVGIKGSYDRVIPLKADTYLRLKQQMPQQGLVFSVKKRWVQQLWSTAYAPKIGCTRTLHSLRHTFAIELYKRCMDIRLVQQALGHANIENTMVYASYVHSVSALRAALKDVV